MATADDQEGLPTPQPTSLDLSEGNVEGELQVASPTSSIRKSFTLTDLKEPAMEPMKTDEGVSAVPSDAKPTPQPTGEHHGLAASLDEATPPMIKERVMPNLRAEPLIDEGDQVIPGVRHGFPTPVLVPQSLGEHHHHPWGPPPHFGPPQFGPPPFGPAYWGPPPHFGPSPCGAPHWGSPQWQPLSEPQWPPQPQSQPQWPPAPAPSEPIEPSPAPQGREAFRMHVGAKGNDMDAFLQAMIKAMLGMKTDKSTVQSGSQVANALKPEDTPQQQHEQVLPGEQPTTDGRSSTSMADAAGLLTSAASDPFAFSYSPPPAASARAVRVTAPPYDVQDGDLTAENFDEVKRGTNNKPELPGILV